MAMVQAPTQGCSVENGIKFMENHWKKIIVHDGPISSEDWEGLSVYHLHFRAEIPKKDGPTAVNFP